MPARFGTDGLRGVANRELTPEVMVALGRAVVRTVGSGPYLLGRDTRLSGAMLASALAAGVASEGVEVLDLGVIPTPAVAYLASVRACPGLVVSASHNPFPDNGVKVFARGGTKLPPATESSVENILRELLEGSRRPAGAADTGADGTGISDASTENERAEANGGNRSRGSLPEGSGVGNIRPSHGLADDYRHHLVSSLEGRNLKGLSVVLDCAHGASFEVAGQVFERLGATVEVIAAAPDGTNINSACGSTDPSKLGAAVVERSADLGLAFDGDADRVIAVDHHGRTIDGDHMLALFATDLRSREMLRSHTIAVTVMSNLGLRRAMALAGISVVETPVGDRHVLDALDAKGLSLGGEQSGHIIFRHLATTGDGLLTGLQLADIVARTGRSLAELSRDAMTRLPQRLANVVVWEPEALSLAEPVWEAVRTEELGLGGEGRVLLRPSGTEPVVRVMVEATSESLAEEVLSRLVAVVEESLGGSSPSQ